MQNIRDFSRAKLDREMNVRFLLNNQGDLYFFFIISTRTVSTITEKKNKQKSMATFLPNEVNSTGGDITGRTAEHVQIMFF